MSDKHFYFRATIDFTTWDERLAKRLRAAAPAPFSDEQLGQRLGEAIHQGGTEIDAISNIENHGDSEEPL